MSFVRQLQTSAKLSNETTKAVKNANSKFKKLKSTPNLYNPKSSAYSYRGVLRAKIEPGVYHQPSQSSSTGSINSETFPRAFLPREDPRTKFVQLLRPHDRLQASWAPPLHEKKEKSYHLNPEQIAKIKSLRLENPEKYTRRALAKKFNVSPLFVSLVSSATPTRKADMMQRLQSIKDDWHPKRALARDDRKKRKELWYRP
ncbi:LAME_0D01112g1_1 [Lachancea meyersii CBS 8951]|uniref:LAME_0D01112g1_1 n=1 Tax=Lachancea meyersii CBS 8951 TaxID=1266667 RepID=A0A1G4J6L9_9SACH|nr:LAME_0D01112g1_1 [Lachancea meyersii CBS 8951]